MIMAFSFKTAQWDFNPAADKSLKELFKKRGDRKKTKTTAVETPTKKNKQKVHNKINKKNIHKKGIIKSKTDKVKIGKSQRVVDAEHLIKKNPTTDNTFQKQNRKESKINHIKKKTKKHKISNTHINTDLSTDNPVKLKSKQNIKPKSKLQEKEKLMYADKHVFGISRKQQLQMSLRERMLEKLKAARFRYLNEQMYTNAGHQSKKYFEQNPDDYNAYHQGYRQQVSKWPLNPLDIIIAKVNKMPKDYVIADFGCGDAKLAKNVLQKVHSFDLVAVDDSVIACDMHKVPLTNNSVDVVVFCLSLMGTNLKEYIREATRVLKPGGILKIAEVESRFDSVDTFIQSIQKFGYSKAEKDLSHELFWFLDFIKKDAHNIQRHKLPDIQLNPCLYKRR